MKNDEMKQAEMAAVRRLEANQHAWRVTTVPLISADKMARELVNAANTTERVIVFDFNGTDMLAGPGCEPGAVLQVWVNRSDEARRAGAGALARG